MASFLVSGVMHETMACYLLLRPPTGEMVAFFALHCAFFLVEDRCVRWWRARGLPPPPRLVNFGILAATMFCLFLPPICRDGAEETLLVEWEWARRAGLLPRWRPEAALPVLYKLTFHV